MALPESILVVGGESIGNAICKVLGLFLKDSSRSIHIVDIASFGEVDAKPCIGKVAKLRYNLREYRQIILEASGGPGPPGIIRFVHRLRTDLGWEGGFLGIVRTAAEKQRLMEMSLLGEHMGRFRFGNVAGHCALSMPVRLPDILEIVSSMGEMSIEAWHSLKDQSSIASLLERLDAAESMLLKSNHSGIVAIVRNVLNEISKIDWLVLLRDAHKDLGPVNKLIETHPPGSYLNMRDCSAVVEKAREILSKSCIAGTI